MCAVYGAVDGAGMAQQRSENLARGSPGAGNNRTEEDVTASDSDEVEEEVAVAAGDEVGEEEEGGDEGAGRLCHAWRSLDWLDENPTGVPTERELFSTHKKRPVYRFLLVRR